MAWQAFLTPLALGAYAASAVGQIPAPTPGLPPGSSAYDAMPDNPGTGPYPAVKEVDPSLPGHVVYRPANLRLLGAKKLAVLIWGNGGCTDDGASARLYLEEIASHGYLVIAPGRILSGPGAPPHASAPAGAPVPAGPLPVKTTTPEVLEGLTWALAENGRRGSQYYGKIDARLTAVSGTSCGGLEAIQAAADPRIRAAVFSHTGIFPATSNPIQGLNVDKSALRQLHTPVLYILGGKSDIAWRNGTDDFARIDHLPVMLVSSDIGHGGSIREANGGAEAKVALDWLEWRLRRDKRAAATFVGPKCRLCVAPAWTVERKKIS